MTARPNAPNKLGRQRREILLAALTALADAGKPMLSNDEIAAIIGGNTDSTAQACLRGMEAHGLIKIEYTPRHQRRVTILATGKSTGWQPAPKRGRKVNPNSRRSRQRNGSPTRAKSPPLVFQTSTITAGYSDSILYGADASAVRGLRRAGETVWLERLGEKPTGRYVLNGRFVLDSADLRARAARLGVDNGR